MSTESQIGEDKALHIETPPIETGAKIEILTESPYSSALLAVFVLAGKLPPEYLTLNDDDKIKDTEEVESAKVYALQLKALTNSLIEIEQGNPNEEDNLIFGNNISIRGSLATILYIQSHPELAGSGIVEEMEAGQERLKKHMYEESIFIKNLSLIYKDKQHMHNTHMLHRQICFYQLAIKFFNESSDIDCYLHGKIPDSFYENTLPKKWRTSLTRNNLNVLTVSGIGKLLKGKKAAAIFLEILKKDGNSTQGNPLAKTHFGMKKGGIIQFKETPEIRDGKVVQKLDLPPLPDNATAIEKANRISLITKIVSYRIMTPSVFKVIQENNLTISSSLKQFVESTNTIDPSKREEFALEARITTQMLIEINKDLVVNEEESLENFEQSGLLTKEQVEKYKQETKHMTHPDEKFITLLKILVGKENYTTFIRKLWVLEPSLLAETLVSQDFLIRKYPTDFMREYERIHEINESSPEVKEGKKLMDAIEKESIQWGFEEEDFSERMSAGSWTGI